MFPDNRGRAKLQVRLQERLRLQEGVWKEALRLSWPATLALLLHSFYRVSDQYWIKPLGAPAQAALGLNSFMLILNFALITLVHTGSLSRIARATGAQDRAGVQRVYQTAMRFGGVWFVFVGLIGWWTTPIWVRAMGAHGDVAQLADQYLRWIYVCLPLIGLKPVVDGMFIGLGNTSIPMLLSFLSVSLNWILNPILIYGWGPAPEWGVMGAAIATGISRGFSAALGCFLLAKHWNLRLSKGIPWDWREVGKICRIGLPMTISTAAYAGVFIAVLATSIEPYGKPVQAGLGVGFNGVEAIAYCGLMGPAIAVSGMVGRRLGARDSLGAKHAVWACGLLSGVISILFSLLFLAFPVQLAGIYSNDPVVIREAVLYLTVVAWSVNAVSAYSIMEQALAGAGKTMAISTISILGNVLRIPLCWAMAHPLGWGPGGAWWALNLSNYLKLAAIFAFFRRGSWSQDTFTEDDQTPPTLNNSEDGAGISTSDRSQRLPAGSN